MKLRTLIISLAVILGSSMTAQAQSYLDDTRDVPVRVAAQPKPAYKRYGWQSMLIDAAGVGLFIGGASLFMNRDTETPGELMLLGSTLVYSMGPPMLHLAHDNPRGFLYSAGLRMALPAAGLIAGIAIAEANDRCAGQDEDCEDWDIFTGMGLGIAGGMGAAMVIDWLWVSKVRHKDSPGQARVLVPTIDVRQSAVSIGLGGTF